MNNTKTENEKFKKKYCNAKGISIKRKKGGIKKANELNGQIKMF